MKTLNIIKNILLGVLIAFLITSIFFCLIKGDGRYYDYVYNSSYGGYIYDYVIRFKSPMYFCETLSILVIVFSGICLVLTPFLFAFRKNKILILIYILFLLGSAGVYLALGIDLDYYLLGCRGVLIIVFSGVEILFGFFLIFTAILSFFEKNNENLKKIIKSLNILKENGLLTDEEYNSKMETITKRKNDDPDVCPKCGRRRNDGEKFCSSCGYKFKTCNTLVAEENNEFKKINGKVYVTGLTKVAEVFFYIGVVLTCCSIIGLAWALPMMHTYKKHRDNYLKHSVGFKVCTIIFISEVAGILMFIDYKH